MTKNIDPEKIVREIKRKTRRKFSAEEKIRIVLEGLRGEETIADSWPNSASVSTSVPYLAAMASSACCWLPLVLMGVGLFKTEVIHRLGPWGGVDQVEMETLVWVDWFNNRRLLEPIGNIPPAKYEDLYYRSQESQTEVAGLK